MSAVSNKGYWLAAYKQLYPPVPKPGGAGTPPCPDNLGDVGYGTTPREAVDNAAECVTHYAKEDANVMGRC